jgi:regulatory protein
MERINFAAGSESDGHTSRLFFVLGMSGVITALQIQKKNKERVNVYIDGRYAFGLAAIEAVKLRRGQKLSDDEIAVLQEHDEAHQAHEAALRYLDYRPRSVDEIRRHLKSKDVEPEVVARRPAIEPNGSLDDRLCTLLAGKSAIRPAARALRMELRQKACRTTSSPRCWARPRRRRFAYRAAMTQARKSVRPIRTNSGASWKRTGAAWFCLRHSARGYGPRVE